MAQKRPLSTYGSLSCDLASTIPKRNIRKNIWNAEKKMQSKLNRPFSFSEGTMEKEAPVPEAELPPDQGYVKKRTSFFENISTDTNCETSGLREEPPVEVIPKVVKFRVKKSNYGYSAPRHRKSEIIMKRISQYELNENGIIRQVKNDDCELSNFPKKKISRQHTFQCTSYSPARNRGQKVNKIAIDKPQTSSKNELKLEQRQKTEATNERQGVREAPDKLLLPVPAVSCRPNAKPVGLGRRRCESENLSSKNIVSGSLCHAEAMNDSWNETITVPRIVAASVKSYKDIPEALFNSLPESSVDPSSDGDEPQDVKSEWKNMLKVRHALQLSAPEYGTPIKEELISIKNKSGKGPGKDITSNREEKILYSQKSQRSKDFVKEKETNKKTSSSLHCSSPDAVEYHRQLEKELQANGIYFRLPPPPPTDPRLENYSPDEVKVALDTLDASLEGFSSNSSSESVSLTHSRSSSVKENQFIDRSHRVKVSNCELKVGESAPNKTSHNFKEKPFYKDCIVVSKDNFYIKQSPERTIIHVSSKMGDEESTSEKTESFNLIEEVYVSSRTKAIPGSTVQMKAYYPGVDFTKSTATLGHTTVDNDSGHESGATSPCGTLTGEDTLTPPSSPSTLKQNDDLNCTPQGHPPTEVKIQTNTTKNENPEINTDLSCAVAAHNENDDCMKDLTVDEPPSVHFVVVAIDFGTTYSGYAFSFTRDPENIHMMKKWEGGDPGIQNEKTPTIVLLSPDEEFHSLGFAARDTFHDLDPKEAQKWLYFDKFKMELHSNKALTRDTLLTAKNGKKVPALKIFYLALRYFREHAIKELSEQTGIEVEDEDIRWVITVPAIWSHPAKQFMRTAAYQAGMGSPSKQDKLLIALEPEAAAIYCRRLKQNQLLQDKSAENKLLKQVSSVSSSGSVRSMKGNQDEQIPELDRDMLVSMSLKKNEKVGDMLKKGTTYMVVDCGGGTVDITVHQMTDRRSGHLKELHKATGGSYGSIGVDKEFEELLNTVFGLDFMSLFKEQRSAAYVNLMIAFESRKRNASPYKSSPLNIALPFSFIDLYKKTNKKEVESAIKKHSYLGIFWSPQGMLRIEQETMKKLFTPTLTKISQAIRFVLSSPEVEGIIQYMFLVGGFSESELLQKHIRDTFSQEINVIIPQGMGLAILRGAVQFGLDPSVVTVRRSRLTYGVGILNTFIENDHPLEKKVLAAGREWCADILDRFVEVDESVAVGDVVTRSYTPATPTQKSVILHLYATSQQNVKYVTDPSVEKVGTLHLDLGERLEENFDPNPAPSSSDAPTLNEVQQQQREITVHLNFGGTEIKASAVDHYTGQCVKTTIEFLSL